MEVLIKIAQVVLALSLLILIHEFGHFLFARLFKIRVDKFYLFFNPWFSLVKFKPKNSDTEYGIGWLPLGGYCKISGMIDESMDKEQLKGEPKPWEFRSKPAWQRFFVMFGGVLFNIVLAIILYGIILFSWGEEYISTRDAVYGVQCNELAREIGFRNGDRILAFDDRSVENDPIHTLQVDLIRTRPAVITVLRGDDTTRFGFDQQYIPELLNTPGIFNIRVPFVVSSVPDTSINVSSLLRSGDRITAINGLNTPAVQDVQEALRAHTNQTVLATVAREDGVVEVPLVVNSEGMIQVALVADLTQFINVTQKTYSFFGAFPAGIQKAYLTGANYVKELGLIFSPKTKAYKSVGSFIAIGNIFPGTWNWEIFWNITAWLSVMLAILNILPIPALDGGHIVLVIYEMITRRKPSDKFLEYSQMAGMVLLLGLMFLAFGNDIIRLFS
ncbi:MAG: RIP metalloprotease RseP [Bacteroidales bacterium]|jgi:regulator of sigma E protease|nr:RIP metalloprotease RseP [Bacteroidales bacterium]MDD4827608.1 RIP metalloprotease RseP [Bacteroidales bacterium]